MKSTVFLLAIFACLGLSQTAPSGAEVYKNRCAMCHDNESAHAPAITALKTMTPARIINTLDFGVMMSVTSMMSRAERDAVANYLGTPRDDRKIPATAFCKDRAVAIANDPKVSWNGWSPSLSNTRFQSAAGLSLDQVRSLKLKWAFGYEGDVNSFAQPAILDGQLFVGSASGLVHALDAKSGCIKWQYQADGPVRTAMLVAPNGSKHSLLFSDQTGLFYAVEAESGKLLWKRRPEVHEATKLTGAPVAYEGVVYVPAASWEENRALNPKYECCTFRGSVTAYRIKDGMELWKAWAIPETPRVTGKTKDGVTTWGPSGAGIWSAPTLDAKRRVLYVGTGNNYSSLPEMGAVDHSDAVLAFDLETGKIRWTSQVTPGDIFNGGCSNAKNCPGPDFDFGASVVLEKLPDGKDILIAGQKSGMVYGLDPDAQGKVIWKTRVGKGGTNGGVQWGMASDGQRVYAAVSDLARIRKADADPLDPRPNAADPKQGGGLTAVRISDGEKAWFAAPATCAADQPVCSPAQPAAVTAIAGAVFSGSVDGHIRAFSGEDGKVLWDFDTAQTWPTVNGVFARGGSMDGPGAVVAGGMVYVNSGYARNGGMAGNVLLAFAP
jgi:polyvinyl alcohol dehydrogenase (cytochrome)